MKKGGKLQIAAIVCAVAAAMGITVGAAYNEFYDSSDDPLISLSYLEKIFKPEILSAVENQFAEYAQTAEYSYGSSQTPETEETEKNEVPETEELNLPLEQQEPVPQQNASAGYEVLELHEGDALYAGDACDIMLRAGSAICIAPDEKQGIADYTSAEEILNGMPLIKNHMCLIPRGDGRGVLAVSESVFIMVRGYYTIVQK